MSSFVRGCKLVAVLAGVFFAGAVAADNPAQGYRSNTWFGTPDNYAEPWKESEAVLPDAPADENLTALISDRFADEYEYVIDRNSVSLQSDLVFRYTVVIRAPTGVSNGFYEGINCETRSYKTYGILTENGFQKTLSSSWKPMPKTGLTIFRSVLLDEFVCIGHSRPASLETI